MSSNINYKVLDIYKLISDKMKIYSCNGCGCNSTNCKLQLDWKLIIKEQFNLFYIKRKIYNNKKQWGLFLYADYLPSGFPCLN